MSTSQIVGYVSISAENNPHIEDTSDRERLASSQEVAEFEGILKTIVSVLENERDEDRIKPDRENRCTICLRNFLRKTLLRRLSLSRKKGRMFLKQFHFYMHSIAL